MVARFYKKGQMSFDGVKTHRLKTFIGMSAEIRNQNCFVRDARSRDSDNICIKINSCLLSSSAQRMSSAIKNVIKSEPISAFQSLQKVPLKI